MAVLNCTPDSFSDGGQYLEQEPLLAAAQEAVNCGASILDIGGESTRPGAATIPDEEELQRVIPAIQAIRQRFPDTCLSIDTRKASVARAAIQAGATMINDVSGLTYDPAMADVAAETGAALVIMHTQGTPETMQLNPTYDDVVQEVMAFLSKRTAQAMATGVSRENIWIDPGFGFGKTLADNLALLRNLSSFNALGYPVLVGTSRKSFLTLGDKSIPPDQREALTAASLTTAIQQGAAAVRVHDIKTQGPVVRFLNRLYSKLTVE